MPKFYLLVLFYIFSIQLAFSQEELHLMRLGDDKIADLPDSQDFTENISDSQNGFMEFRYSLMGYRPIKQDGYRVISSHQPDTHFDIVYFIDKNGHTTRRIMAMTAPQNFDGATRAHYDSMNPYGSTGMTSVIINVLLGSVINRGLGLL